MNDLRERVQASQTGTLEKILNAIPGYGGYRDKQLRRDADRLLREHLVRQLDGEMQKLPQLQQRLIEAGHIRLVDDLERVARRLQTVRDQISTATSGYAGFFDALKVREQELDGLYEFDRTLLEEVGQVGGSIAALDTAIDRRSDVAEAIHGLGQVADRLQDRWRQRWETIQGL